jgi:hypothetical protein
MQAGSKAGRDGSGSKAEKTDIAKATALSEMVPEITSESAFTPAALRSVDNFDDALAMVTEAHGPLQDAADVLGDGFTLLDKNGKSLLEGIPLVVMEWQFRQGDFGSPFVSVRIAARHRDGSMGKYIINDGGTGIAEQLAKYTKETGKQGGLIVGKGLQKSEYDNEFGHAVTWYLNLSKTV